MTNPNKDPYVSKATKKALMVKIFSSTPNAWFMDILENIPRYREDGPPYWLIFVGQNTRYCEAIPLQSKNILDVKTALTIFVDKYHPTKLTSDCESSFKSDDVKNYLRSKNVNQYFIVDQNHSALGVIDSCIKILRDLNQPQGGEVDEMSYDDKYRHFSMAKMRQVLNIYNSRKQKGLGNHSPEEMKNNPDLEKDYIFNSLVKRDKQERMPGFKLKKGDKVKIEIPKRDPYENTIDYDNNGNSTGTHIRVRKNRRKYTREYYEVLGKHGKMYTLQAEDKTTIVRPRFKLVKVQGGILSKTVPNKYKTTPDEYAKEVENDD
ncbi:hypothetical protein TVAGG3_0955030 [Trichomonas vaginalis G3]|uniref:hypothetical protein n=1 Tax=Trichomonas vaginalis (strain ATCC PRA-98 / G3) TaxID=412133 RepID=UPI0021E60FB1|nr:hypothetical protein TVAGG3_0955030 [Trichomonas vaginalis G3]KAI5487488.1 hypothetical protein TVAGG3_0955030 [Trichomonas vaginalis G3]